jgi:hypothetical protein
VSKGGGGVTIPNPWTILVGSNGSTITVDSDLDNIRIKEIPAITTNSNIAVTQPIVTDSTSKSDSTAKLDLHIDPIKIEPMKVESDSTSAIDLKPIAVDSCQTIKLAPLPPIRLEQPYSQHFGFTFMGIELWGFTMSGKSEMFLHSPPKQQYHTVHMADPQPPCKEPGPGHSPVRPKSGLRVRIADND